MFNFFNTFAVCLKAVVDFIVNEIQALFDLIQAIPAMVVFLNGSIAYLPPFVLPFCLFVVALSVIFLLAGRKGDS